MSRIDVDALVSLVDGTSATCIQKNYDVARYLRNGLSAARGNYDDTKDASLSPPSPARCSALQHLRTRRLIIFRLAGKRNRGSKFDHVNLAIKTSIIDKVQLTVYTDAFKNALDRQQRIIYDLNNFGVRLNRWSLRTLIRGYINSSVLTTCANLNPTAEWLLRCY